MKAKRTITIDAAELLAFLKDKFDIRGHDVEISCRAGNTEYNIDLKVVQLEWTEGERDNRDTWSR